MILTQGERAVWRAVFALKMTTSRVGANDRECFLNAVGFAGVVIRDVRRYGPDVVNAAYLDEDMKVMFKVMFEDAVLGDEG